MANSKTTNLILLGNTGNGKSSTGNSILGHEIFLASDSGESVTGNIDHGQVERKGRVLNVVDTPGLNDTRCQDLAEAATLTLDYMKRGIEFCPEGYDALILVLKYGNRFTHEERQVLSLLSVFLGKDWIRDNCVVIFTNGDSFAKKYKNKATGLKEYCKNQKSGLKELLDECKSRVVMFDNLEPSESQVDELLEIVDKLSKGGQRYSNAQFKKFALERDQELVRANKDKLINNFQGEFDALSAEFKKVKEMKQEDSEKEIKSLIAKCDQLIKNIVEEDKGTGVLKAINERFCDLKVNLSVYEKELGHLKKMREQEDNFRLQLQTIQGQATDKPGMEKKLIILRRNHDDWKEEHQRDFAIAIRGRDSLMAAQLCLLQNKMEFTHNMNAALVTQLVQQNEYFKQKVDKLENRRCIIS